MLDALNAIILRVMGRVPDEDEDEVIEQKEDTENAEDEGDSEESDDTESDNNDAVPEDDSDDSEEVNDEPEEREVVKSGPSEYEKLLRKENKKRRLEFRVLQEKMKKIEEDNEEREKQAKRAKMKEAERLKAEKDDADEKVAELMQQVMDTEKARDTEQRKNGVIAIASVLGFTDPEDAVAMLGTSIDDFEIDDAGINRQDIEDALRELLETKPYLRKQEKDKPKESSKTTNQPSATKVKRPTPKKGDDDDEEELNRQMREARQRGDGTVFQKLWNKRYALRRKKHTGPGVFESR